jgi:hypothetical protein
MAQERKLTTIGLPHKVLEIVGPILVEAGFQLGTVGGGYGEMERDGEISEDEKKILTAAMAEELFCFEVQEIPEDDEDADEDLG